MSDAGKRAIALGAWERALTDYRAAAEQAFGRGALAGRPDDVELDVLEVLEWEQRRRWSAISRAAANRTSTTMPTGDAAVLGCLRGDLPRPFSEGT